MHTRTVQKLQIVTDLKTATLSELLEGINERAKQLQSFSMTVNIAATVGGAHKGSVTDYTSFTGYILIRKPESVRVLGLLPVVRTKAFDMASDGTKFRLLIPAKGKAFEGSDKIVTLSANPIENLRPYIFVQSLLVGSVDASEFTYLADDESVVPGPKKILREVRDYDVGVLRRSGESNQLAPRRIVHISRQDLLPFEQDFYNDKGIVETQAFYSNYQTQNGIQFPMQIKIKRPQEEFELNLTVTKLLLNQPLNDDQFTLNFPPEMAVTKLP